MLPMIRAFFKRIPRAWNKLILVQQVRLSSHVDGLLLLSLLAVFCGIFSAAIILVFRLTVEGSLSFLLPGSIESFEALSSIERILLCGGGGLLVGLLLQCFNKEAIETGVTHVIERLDYHQGYMPIKNTLVQFVGAAISLISGQSTGREGPSVHLGASSGSVLGRLLSVPNNSLRTLVACGVAAAISALFNTPLAAVIFAMEVVLIEYTIIGFTPVILSAVSAVAFTRIFYGDYTPFVVPAFELHSMLELPVVILLGLIIGILSVCFSYSTLFLSNISERYPIWTRTTAAGLITGLLAVVYPQIMGTGYDTVSATLLTQIGLSTLVILTAIKIISTAFAIGLGIPAGLIGPTLFIGACAGSTIGIIVESTILSDIANPGFYAMLGMAAMMAATLQAPLAALIYLFELTANEAIIMPGMIAVVVALLVVRIGFKQSSIYRQILLHRGRDYRNNPVSQALRRIGVASIMDRNIVQHHKKITTRHAARLLKRDPEWILLTDGDKQVMQILPATDLARHISGLEDHEVTEIDMLAIPALRLNVVSIPFVATLQEAHQKMQSESCDILVVTSAHRYRKQSTRIHGIVSRLHIERSYQM